MEPLGWDEIVSQPGMGGYLSFLNGPVALPHLAPTAPASESDPVVEASTELAYMAGPDPIPESDAITVVKTTPGPDTMAAAKIIADPNTTPEDGRTPQALSAPQRAQIPGVKSPAVLDSIPAVFIVPGVEATPRRPRIRHCIAAHDGHSNGEEVLYQALWKAAQPESVADSRTITIGWRGMSQLCRMTPKNCKINAQRLLRKLALEILSPYNTPESIGTTYRIFSANAIVQRRHNAGYEWVIRSRGVEFVNPATGAILPMCADTH